MKINKKIIIGFLLIFIIFNFIYIYSPVFAAFPKSESELAEKGGSAGVQNGVKMQGFVGRTASTVVRFLQILAIGISLIRLSWVAIKYFSASAVGKGEIKKSGEIWRCIIGSVIAVGAISFVDIIVNAIYNS